MQLTPGTQVTANVRLLQPLGQGGMGSVWVAEHLGLHTRVAVKFIASQNELEANEARARFQREASLAAQIRSPHVVQMFDHGLTQTGVPYIVMELMHGESLGDRIARSGPLPLAQTAALVNQVAQVLSEAHALGAVHRDIKPSNVFLVQSGYELFVKVLDFGIAKVPVTPSQPGVTNTGSLLGTPRFMSPESIGDARAADARTDLWALSAVAYESLTGRPAFAGETLGQVLAAVVSFNYQPPSQLVPGLPPQLDVWFAKAFHRDVNQRFQSASELAQSFAQVAAGGAAPALSGPAPPWQGGVALQTGQPIAQTPTAASWPMQQPPAAPAPKSRAWVWVLLGAGLVAVLVVAVAIGSGFWPQQTPEHDRSARKADDDAAPKPEASSEPSSSSTSSSSVDPSAVAPSKPPSPGPTIKPPTVAATATPTATTSAAPEHKSIPTGSAKAVVLTCWAGNEGMPGKGTPASSATVTVFFGLKGSVRSVGVAGPAQAHKRFTTCTVRRLVTHSFDAGDEPSVTFTVSLPASPPEPPKP